jgi:glutamate racemase
VRQLQRQLPGESIVYLGDTARVPYGTRSAATVVRYARGCAQLLTQRNIKVLVVACNTVSAVALEILKAELDLPVIGVVGPGASAAVQAATELSEERAEAVRIGVLGTLSTVRSGAYPREVARHSSRFEVVAQAAPLLVPLVEEGWLEGDVPRLAVERYLRELLDKGASVIVLGCTHYPLLRQTIGSVAASLCARPPRIVDSTAGTLELLVTDLPDSFQAAASRFLGQPVNAAEQVDITPAEG